MKDEFNLKRDYNNKLEVQSVYCLSELRSDVVLIILTNKKYKTVDTSAHVVYVQNDDYLKSAYFNYKCAPFSDYFKIILKSKIRATEKNLLTQHKEVLKDIDKIKQEVLEYYKNKELMKVA